MGFGVWYTVAPNAKERHEHHQVGSMAMISWQVSLSWIKRDVAQTPGREWNRQEAGFLFTRSRLPVLEERSHAQVVRNEVVDVMSGSHFLQKVRL